MRIDVLFTNLADDQPIIARKITKLLIPSYFPSKVTEEEACKRFITLIKRSPRAGARFCEFAASEGASLRSLMRLFKTVIGLTVSSDELDKDQIEGLLIAGSHLCTDLVKDASLRSSLKEELSAKKLKILFAVASSTRAQSSICNIISSTSLDSAGDLFEPCMDLITKCSGLSNSVEMQAEVRSAHKMMLSCGWFDTMLESLVEVLQRAASGCQARFGIEIGKQSVKSATRTKPRSSKKVSSKSKHINEKKKEIQEDYELAVGVARQIRDLLQSENTRKAILGSGIIESAYSALKVLSEASIQHCLQYDYMNTYIVSAYTTLTLHMSLHNLKADGSSDSQASDAKPILSDMVLHACFMHLMCETNWRVELAFFSFVSYFL